MPVTRIHFYARKCGDASSAKILFAASPVANAVIDKSTPPDRDM